MVQPNWGTENIVGRFGAFNKMVPVNLNPPKKEVDGWVLSYKKVMFVQVSHEKNPYYFPLNPGWLIGILIMDYYDPYIPG